MKVAIFHNFLDNIGGAEVVDLIMARELKADIYTTNIDQEKIRKMGFATDNIFSIGKIPINAPYKQEFAYWKFRNLNLGKKYDFYIIAGDWAVSAANNHHPNLWYVYSPMREIFDLYRYTRKNTVPFFQKPFFDLWVLARRLILRKEIKKIDSIVAISQNVASRVKKYLGRESEVIYPPVEVDKYSYQKNGDFWLSVNRLINHKRVEIQLKAFAQLPQERLIIVGSYEKARHFQKYADYLKKIKPDNVKILSWVDDLTLKKLYSTCRGFITTARYEDFGLTPIEAMASGKPVIAPNKGGYEETIIDNITGKLINNINEGKLIEAIKAVGANPQCYKDACLNQAKKFDVEIFIKQMKKEIL